ncbi:ADP-ribosylation family protein [Actinocatenispora sera]|uniref:ADP-ribosylation family protein n=1 Tax=Actinocatenispora sera TaxID=390989 RepID=UPI000A75E261|nr:ADP-ribosylation family protein [Actinocatenispora sera]
MDGEARRTRTLTEIWSRFPALEERVRRVYGLRVPRHLAVFAALWHSADDAEREGLNQLGVAPFGLTEYLAPDGLSLVGAGGLDERLHGRYRCDPAEFVTVLGGDSDGLHYGLWYDDPAQLPAFVVFNWARDSAETWTNGAATLLVQLRHRIDAVAADYGADGPEARALRPLAAALDWFAAADREAVAADGLPSWAQSPRQSTAVSLFPVLPTDSGDPRLESSGQRLRALQAGGPDAASLIAEAERQLAAGQPAYALAVGSELHWIDADEYRDRGLALLVGAYQALGRDALADIAEVHAAHRDLRSVSVLTRTH